MSPSHQFQHHAKVFQHFYNPFYVSTIKMQKLSVSVYQKNGQKMAAFVNWNGCNYKWVVVWVTQVLHVSNVAGNIFNADCKSCKCKFTQNRSRYSKIQTSTWNNTIKTALSFNGKAIKIVRTVTYRMERLPKKIPSFITNRGERGKPSK